MRILHWLFVVSLVIWPVVLYGASYEEINDLVMERRYAQKLQAGGRYQEALKQAQQVLEKSRRMFAAGHRDIGVSMDVVASILRKMGRFEEAEQYFRTSLEMTRRQRLEAPADYATALQNLAGLYREMGRYHESELLYRESLATLKAMTPRDEEALVSVSGNLAVLYRNLGRYAEAEPLLKAEYEWALKQAEPDALAVRMGLSMDAKRIFLADRMSNLAGLYLEMRRIAEAQELTAAALEIKRQVLKVDDPRLIRELNNLGMIYRNNGRMQEAEPLLRQAVAGARRVYGNNHPELAVYLDNLALVYQRVDNYRQAEQFQREAIAISEQALGRSHPNTLMQRNNLAVNYLMQDRYAEAEPLLRGIVADSAAGPAGANHPEAATRTANLALALVMQGKHLEGHRLQAASIRISERKRDDLFLILTEQQKLHYLRDELLQVRQHLAHTRQLLAENPDAAATALDSWLRWKGIVMESQGRYVEALHRTDDPLLKQKFDELLRVRRQLAGQRMVQPTAQAAQAHGARIELLEHQKELLEAELTRRSAPYARAGSAQRFASDELRRLLPKDTAFVDFALVEDWHFKPLQVRGLRYLAFVVSSRPGSRVQLLDLGPGEAINQAITVYRSLIALPARGNQADHTQLASVSAELHRLLMEPLLPHLQGIKSLIISPDAGLHLVPFEVLRGRNKPYLLEQYAISYVGSGRDMARFGGSGTTNRAGEALLLADPDYDLQSTGQAPTTQPVRVIGQLQGVQFSRLPDTRVEADAIAALLRKSTRLKVRNLTGAQAVESALLTQVQPAILHLATHGFFLKDEKSADLQDTRGLKAVPLLRPAATIQTELLNPMLRSGIVLAGVNRALAAGRDDGLVTAEKILEMRLLGTDLVTLSACETGVGDVRAGEGVFGLKRAFVLAGARTVVLSLWSVPSRETTELMTEFYRLMMAGSSKAAALRQAQLKMLQKYPHPFYWGAFQLVGSPN